MQYSNVYFESIRDSLESVSNYKELNGQKIFVTGSTGLIGSAIVDTLIYLNEYLGYEIEIYAASRTKENAEARFGIFATKKYFHVVVYEANEDLKIPSMNLDYMIHCASNAHPQVYIDEPVETMLGNFIGLNNLLKYAYLNKAKRVLYISSSEVYGKKPDELLYQEDDFGYVNISSPRACYPSSKRAAETLCVSYMEEYNVDVVIARPGHIYGPTMTEKDSRASAEFFRTGIKNNHIVMKSAGNQLRSYCYVLDCVSAILCVLLNGSKGEAYNISNKNSIVTIRELAEEISRQTQKEIVYSIPTQQEKSGYNPMTCSALDSTKLESLGWEGKFTLEKGVAETLSILGCK